MSTFPWAALLTVAVVSAVVAVGVVVLVSLAVVLAPSREHRSGSDDRRARVVSLARPKRRGRVHHDDLGPTQGRGRGGPR
jgi:hypothetical protein